MKSNKEAVFDYVYSMSRTKPSAFRGFETQEIAEALGISRANVSTLLNQLVRERRLEKSDGRPVCYRLLRKGKEEDCFYRFKGVCPEIRNAVSLAKAAVLYPNDVFSMLLTGERGTGKNYFADLVHELAVEGGKLAADAPYIKFNCAYFAENPALLEENLDAALSKAAGGMLFIKHIDRMNSSLQATFFEKLPQKQVFLICSTEKTAAGVKNCAFAEEIPFLIHLPSLEQRGVLDRLILIDQFLREESGRTGREILVGSELNIALGLYRCEGNLKQLRRDIQSGCANAFVRTYHAKSDQLKLTFEDFPVYVRKGFLNYQANKAEISRYLRLGTEYSYTPAGSGEVKEQKNHGQKETIYDLIEKRITELEKNGLDEESIQTAVFGEIERSLAADARKSSVDRESLSKIVSPSVIVLVENHLKEASALFRRAYPESVYCGLCLHVNEAVKGRRKRQYLSNERITQVMQENREEYELSLKFGKELEKQFHIRLPMEEIVFMTMFISRTTAANERRKTPALLVAMHGESTASSLAAVVAALTHVTNTYAFDMSLSMKIDAAYEELKTLMIQIGEGGILFLYDMGSLRTFAETIGRETGIPVRCVEIPVTLAALDLARRIDMAADLDEAVHGFQESYARSFPELAGRYERNGKQKLILTLCMSGEGGAIQIKQYLEKHADISEYQVIALSISDRDILLGEVNALMEDHEISCIIGTYDPGMFGIRFIPVSRIFGGERLEAVLGIDYEKEVSHPGYELICRNLEEEYPDLDMKKLRRHLPRAIEKIQKCAHGLNEDQEIGLFMHIASLILRMVAGQPLTPYPASSQVIQRNKRLYHDLKDTLNPLEKAYSLEIPDAEIAYLIDMIKMK